MRTRSGERNSTRLTLFIALLLGVALPVHAERVWIVAGPSDTSVSGIAKKVEPYYRAVPDGFVVPAADCGDKQNAYMWIGATAIADKPALAARLRIRQTVPDAYMRLCDVRPGSFMALRMSAIDRSIGLLPDNAANWEPADRLSLLKPLPDGRMLVIVRYFANDAGDPFGGKRERVMLVSRGRRVVLDNDCVDPSDAVTQHGYIAFECVRGLASDNVVHGVPVFDGEGSKLFEARRCRDPQWTSDLVLACDAEDVDTDKRLQLNRKRIAVQSGQELK